MPGWDALLRTLTALGLGSLLSLVTLFNIPVEIMVFKIFNADTVLFKLNSEFQWKERESNMFWFVFLILLLVLACCY